MRHKKRLGAVIVLLLVVVSFGFFLRPTQAAAIVWNNSSGDGLWSTNANWVGGVKPGASDVATFNSTSTTNATIDAAFAGSVAGISIASSYTGIITQARSLTVGASNYSQAAGTFIGATQDITINGSYSLTGGTFTTTSGNMAVTGAFTASAGTLTATLGTITATGNSATWDINATQTFNNFTINKNSGNNVTLGTGDTFVIAGTLTLTQGGLGVGTGTIDTRGNTTQAAAFAAATSTNIIDFGDNAVAQTYTVNGGGTPIIRLNSAADASDSIVLGATSIIGELRITSGFSGTIPFSNSGNFTPSFNLWSQAAGTYDASAQTGWNISALTISGGTFTPPSTVTTTGNSSTWDVNTSQTFNNITLNKTAGQNLIIGAGDTFVTTGTLTLTSGILIAGTIDTRGNVTQGSAFGSANNTTVIDFGDNAVAQTYTVNGGITPVIRLDSASDANDSIVLAADASFKELRSTSGFSGTIPLVNSGNFTPTFTLWNQAAGTYDASAQTAWVINGLTISGGTFTPPTTVTTNGVGSTWNINSTQTFTNVTVNKNVGPSLALGTGDTIIITGTLTLTQGGLSTGSVDARGNVTVGSGFGGGTTPLLFSGSSTQTFTLTGATGLYDADITVNKSGGQVNLASALVMDAANQDLDIQEGTLNLAGNNLTVNGTSGTTVVEDGGTLKLYGSETFVLNAGMPTLQSGSTVLYTGDGDSASDTYTVTTLKAAYHHLTINSTDGATDTFQLGSAIDMNGDFTLTAGTFDVTTGNHQMNVAGNWSKSGTFSARNGTVILDGTNQTLTGATTFNNFTKSVSSAATLTLPASTTTTVLGTLTFNGASGQLLSLRSSSTGTQTNLSSSGTRSLSYLNVQDNNATNAVKMGCGSTCVDAGNNTNWVFVAAATVSAISGNTTEAGGTATFSVVLDLQPSANVTIPVSSSDTTEGTVSTALLTFTNANWSTPQTVTVTGVDDFLDDGDIAYTVVLAAASSSDAGYSGLNPNDVSLTNTDNDTSGINVSTISGDTAEGGGTATFSVVLDSQPSADVTVPFSSNDTSEGTVSTSPLTFTSENWNTPQTAIVTGVDDFLNDGDITYTILIEPTSSADSAYNGLNPSDVSVSNIDNDTPGISVSAISGYTTEDEGAATFTVVLLSQPAADVSMGVASNNAAEGTVSVSSLTFASADWDMPQTVTVTGVDDSVADGNITYSITLSAATSADADYSGFDPDDVTAVNTDNDTPGLTISSISGNTTEAGGTATFTVQVNTQPTDDLTMGVASDNTAEGTVSTDSLTFTNANWDVPQTVTVTGVNDAQDDGDVMYHVAFTAIVSADPMYSGLSPTSVTVVNTNDDTAGITLIELDGTTNVTEGGVTDTYTLVLTSQPTSGVMIVLTPDWKVSVDVSSLVFTTSDWNIPQTVIVTAVDDQIIEGNHVGTITNTVMSSDPMYDALSIPTTLAFITDNDVESGGSTGYVPPVQHYTQGTITILSPLSQDIVPGGEITTIGWTMDGSVPGYVDLFYSVDDGLTYGVIADNIENNGTYDWIVPNIDAPAVIIKILGTDIPPAYSGSFSIQLTVPPALINPSDVASGTSPFTGSSEDITHVDVGDVVRAPHYSTVYYIDNEYSRHPFIDAQTYYTYYSSFSSVKEVTGATLALFPMGDPMFPKPGTVLIKIQSVIKAYVISEMKVLRWIPTEDIAKIVFGKHWADYVIDLPPTMFYHFTRGLDVGPDEVFDTSIMKRRVDLHE